VHLYLSHIVYLGCSFRLLQGIDLPISHFRNLTTQRTWLGVLGLALGTNAKVAGSLNDLKDEKVLPRRYDNDIAYQEKLRQVSMKASVRAIN